MKNDTAPLLEAKKKRDGTYNTVNMSNEWDKRRDSKKPLEFHPDRLNTYKFIQYINLKQTYEGLDYNNPKDKGIDLAIYHKKKAGEDGEDDTHFYYAVLKYQPHIGIRLGDEFTMSLCDNPGHKIEFEHNPKKRKKMIVALKEAEENEGAIDKKVIEKCADYHASQTGILKDEQNKQQEEKKVQKQREEKTAQKQQEVVQTHDSDNESTCACVIS